jgi:hypothetical protein
VATVLDPVVSLHETLGHRGRVVRGEVVDDEHPHVDAALAEDAVHAPLEHVGIPVARHDHRDRGQAGSPAVRGGEVGRRLGGGPVQDVGARHTWSLEVVQGIQRVSPDRASGTRGSRRVARIARGGPLLRRWTSA